MKSKINLKRAAGISVFCMIMVFGSSLFFSDLASAELIYIE